jgi:hypothetical protein
MTQAPIAGAPALLIAHVITLLHYTSSPKLQAGCGTYQVVELNEAGVILHGGARRRRIRRKVVV